MATSRALIYFIQRRHFVSCMGVNSFIKPNLHLSLCIPKATFADQKAITKSEQNETGSEIRVGLAETVKENTKSAWYMSVIIAGIGVTAVMFYAIFRELFSSKSSSSVYSRAFDRCINDQKVVDRLGAPIKAFGEETRRGRRTHVKHMLYEKDGVNYMKMSFHLKGSRQSGKVHLSMREDKSGNWMYRYLFVQLKDISRSVIILEDNRSVENNVYTSPEQTHELIPPPYTV